MDIYLLDDLLRPIDIVDQFISIIWTERFDQMGDFELVTHATPANRKRFVFDTMISIPDSKRIMRVMTIEEQIDFDHGAVLKVKGLDFLSILDQRTAVGRSPNPPYLIYSAWNHYGWTPLELMVLLVMNICVGGEISPDDIIPFLQDIDAPSLYPADTIPEPAPGGIEWSTPPSSLYVAVSDIAKAYDLGFRMYKHPDESKIYFESYTGCDRTTAQTTLPPVIFSQDMENLQGTNEYSDNTKHYNAVHVIYQHKDAFDNDITTSLLVTDDNLEFSLSGFSRKGKPLVITQLPEGISDVNAYLQQLGEEELIKSRPSIIFDGEIDKNSEFVYEQDYFMGDIVEVRGTNGGTAYMRVVEQIIKEDASGKSSYPSLITKTSINPGTWRSWKYNVGWSAMGSGEYWDNQ